MGCFGHRQRDIEIRPEQKWDYISLTDFKSTSCFAPFAYAYLYLSLLLSVAVYAVDTFTAVNLLIFNQWSSEIKPTQLVSFDAAKWIFSICIILSIINLGYEHLRAHRIMRRGSVAECYLDNLAVRLESIRWGKGQGWKRFLVFAELTKSKKGTEYVALFTYFSFQSWIRVLLCSGPRQVVNALTLLSVYNARLSVTGDDVGNTLLHFFDKIGALANENHWQALILSGMVFTVIIWVFSFLSLLLAFFFFIFFLIFYIPRSDGGLSAYCSRKINKRLMKIVSVKVNTALAKEEHRRKKAELKAAKKTGTAPPTQLTATIPDLGDGDDDKLQRMPSNSTPPFTLNRSETMSTLPVYSSRPGSAGSFELNAFGQTKPPPPSRSATMASVSTSAGVAPSFSQRAPLLNFAAEPGRSSSPAPSLPGLPSYSSNNGSTNSFGRPPPRSQPPIRSETAASNRTSPATYRPLTGRSNTSASGNMMSPMPYADPTRNVSMSSTNSGFPPVRSPNSHNPSTSGSSSHYSPYNPRNGGSMRGNGPGSVPPPVRSVTNPYPDTSHARQESEDSIYSSYFESSEPPTQRPPPPRQQTYNASWANDTESQRGPPPRSGWY